MITLQQIESRIHELDELIKNTTLAIRHAPEGKIRANPRKGVSHFDLVLSSPDSSALLSRRRLSPADPHDQALAQTLAQKDYDEKVLQCAMAELRLLNRLHKFYANRTPEGIYGKMTPARQNLITPFYMTDQQYAEAWLEKHRLKSRALFNKNGFKSERGEFVRSKSELMIANMLLPRDRITFMKWRFSSSTT